MFGYNIICIYKDEEETRYNSWKKAIDGGIRVEKIILNDIGLQEVPNSICLGNFYNILYLDLSYNRLTELSESVVHLFKLKTLKCNFNKIQFLQNSIDNLTDLEILELNNNIIQDLPITLFNLKNLKKIELKKNPPQVCYYTSSKCTINYY